MLLSNALIMWRYQKVPKALMLGAFFIGVLSCVAAAHSSEDYTKCFQNWWCVEEKLIGERLEVWLKNQTAHAVTVTLEIASPDLKTIQGSNAPEHVTTTLYGQQRINIITLVSDEKRQLLWADLRYHWVAGVLNATHDADASYHLPFAANQNYPIVQGFAGGYSHYGASKYAVDFAMPVGTPVHAARAGIAIDIEQRFDRGGASRRYARYANYIVLLHADGTTGEYYHLQKDGARVHVGEQVSQGQMIGLSGNTGFSSLPHLHFAVYQAKPFGEFQSIPFQFDTPD